MNNRLSAPTIAKPNFAIREFIKPGENLLNNGGRGPIRFHFNGCYVVSIKSSDLISYQFYSSGIRTSYSDRPIPHRGEKTLTFCNYKGGELNFDLFNNSDTENVITMRFAFTKRPFEEKEYFFREWTLDGLSWKTPVQLTPHKEIEISPANYLGAHFEVHSLYSAIYNSKVSCKIEYQNKTIADWFLLGGKYSFEKPWTCHWTYPVKLYLKSDDALEINPDMIYLSGYNIKADDVLKKVSHGNLRSSFLIEGIRTN